MVMERSEWSIYHYHNIGITDDWPWLMMRLSIAGKKKQDIHTIVKWYLPIRRSIHHIEWINPQTKPKNQHYKDQPF